MKIAIYTLGCKVNQYESQAMEQELLRRGHTMTDFAGPADAYIINTCTVTAVSDKKCRNMIRRARKGAPEAVVAVCGCFAQTDPEAAAALGADLVMGSAHRIEFLDKLEALLKQRQAPIVSVDPAMARRDFERLPAGSAIGRTRAMLKIEDGCTNFCTYCIIPYARGPVRSLPTEEAVAQTVALRQQGYQEVVLTGIEISSWGRDLPGRPSLIDLLEAMAAEPALEGLRIRLGSLEPRTITEDFCRRAGAIPALCDHFHLSLQAGSDRTLQRMGRKYDTARYLESVDLLRRQFGDPGITTDLIAGFPGETEEDFQESLDFLRRCAFSAVHVFPYSRRPGTPADKMPDQLSREEKEERSRRAIAVAAGLERQWLLRQSSLPRLDVLFEDCRDGVWRGHTRNYTEVLVPSAENLHNRCLPVRPSGIGESWVTGTLLP